MDDIKTGRETGSADVSAALQQLTKLVTGNQAMLEQWATLGSELVQFMTARLTRNLDLMRAMSQCRDPAELVEAQLRWVRSMFDDYVAETNRLGELNARIFGQVAAPSDENDSGQTSVNRASKAKPGT